LWKSIDGRIGFLLRSGSAGFFVRFRFVGFVLRWFLPGIQQIGALDADGFTLMVQTSFLTAEKARFHLDFLRMAATVSHTEQIIYACQLRIIQRKQSAILSSSKWRYKRHVFQVVGNRPPDQILIQPYQRFEMLSSGLGLFGGSSRNHLASVWMRHAQSVAWK
jgi:hypothetical protein